MISFKFHSGLLKDISSMLNNAEGCNVVIQVGIAKNIKKFYAHSNILRARSRYFSSIIPADLIKKNDTFMINKPDITPSDFEIILKYVTNFFLPICKNFILNIF